MMVLTMDAKKVEDHGDISKNKVKKQRTCQIRLLNEHVFRCDVPKDSKGEVLLQKVFDDLNIIETDYFGLFYEDLSNHRDWLEPNKSIKSQLKNLPWSFHFSVKFFPPDPAQLHEDITRYYMVLQIRDDILTGKLPGSFTAHAVLGSYVIQSELGDYDRGEMKGNYVQEYPLAPNQTYDLEERVIELHKTYRGQTPEQAELNYLENAKKLPLYGVHLYDTQDDDGIKLSIGVSWNGIFIYRDDTLINRFAWPRVIKFSYQRNKFYITTRPLDGQKQQSKIGFKMSNYRAVETVYKSAVEHHGFFRLVRVPTRKQSRFPKMTSKFQYIGRTQNEVRSAVAGSERRRPPSFVRTDSRRSRSGNEANLEMRSSTLPVVREEIVEDLPPPLPEKAKHRLQAQQLQQLPAHQKPPDEEEQKDVRTLEYCDEEEEEEAKFSDPENLEMTHHQKEIHKLKNNSEPVVESVEFLKSTPPLKASSQDSLDALDARLTPRKVRSDDSDHNHEDEKSSERVEIVTTEVTTTVVYEEDTQASDVKHGQLDEEKVPEEVQDDSSSSSSTISSYEDIEKERLRLHDHKKETSSIDSSSADHDSEPVVTSPDDDTATMSDGSTCSIPIPVATNHVIVSSEEPNNGSITSSTQSNDPMPQTFEQATADDPIQIATVETRTVRVEEVLIPQEDNEVHRVSLTTDGDDRIMVSPATDEDGSMSSASLSSSPEPSEQIYYHEPPTVKTEAVVVDSYVEEVPEGTTNPPMVQTELKTITYERTQPAMSADAQPELVSSQVISSETEHTITTTEITKTIHGDISETKVEKQVVTIGGSDHDHNKAMAEMILDTQRNNPNVSITKVVVHEERPVAQTDP